LISTLGILLLYILSLSIQPIAISLDEVSNFEGRYVRVSGEVLDVLLIGTDNQIISIIDKNAELTIFSEKWVDVDIGDTITVEGRVERYRGKLEIVTDGMIRILSHSSNTSLYKLSNHPQRFVNMEINTIGYIQSIEDNIITLKEGKYSISAIASPIDLNEISAGDRILINGTFLYDKHTFSYYILSARVTRIV
jgi:DNA/RNA endonuclease YhcR with UshA esterase domain